MNDFESCLKNNGLAKVKADKEIIKKEIESSEYDLDKAIKSLKNNDAKWASIKAYYSMFHSAKALVFKKGYREKSHYCLLIALRELYGKKSKLNKTHINNFEICMDIRQEADYGLSYDKEKYPAILKI